MRNCRTLVGVRGTLFGMTDTPTLTTDEVISSNIRVLLAEKNIRQADLADSLGHVRSWLSERLSGKRRTGYSTRDLDELAGALGVTVERLVQRRVE